MIAKIQNAYAPGTPGLPVFPVPVIAERAPTTSDIEYPYLMAWFNKNTSTAYQYLGAGNWVTTTASGGPLTQLTGDTGTAIPSSGSIKIAGTAGQITSTASGSTDTLSIPAVFVAPGTIAASTGFVGQATATPPTAGNIGEQIRSAVATPGTTLTSATPADVTTIALTAGIWDVSAIVQITGTLQTLNQASINTTTAIGTVGDNAVQSPVSAIAGAPSLLTIPAFRVSLATTTTYHLVAESTYTGSATAFGRISATRVA